MAAPVSSRPLRRVDDLYDVTRPSDGIAINTFAVLLFTGFSLGATWLVTVLAGWLTWLYWPAIVVLAGAALFALVVAVMTLRMAARRQDTPTSTIRGAAQGEVELRGHVHPIPGRELASDLLNASCICFSGTVAGQGSGDQTDETLLRVEGRRSFLLRDATGEVFVPGSFADEGLQLFSTEFMRELPATVAWRVGSVAFKSFRLREALVPTDIDVQVNGVFTTLGADESFLDAHEARWKVRPDAEIETDWRAYADAALATVGPDMPAPRLNAILALGDSEAATVSNIDDDQSSGIGTAAFLLLMGTPPAVTALHMLGLIDVHDLILRALALLP